MHSGYSSFRTFGSIALIGSGLLAFSGCNQANYDPNLAYAVRNDFIVSAVQPWTAVPTKFNHPGVMPLDDLKSPTNGKVTPDQQKLRDEIGKKLLDPDKLRPEVRDEFAKVLKASFGTPAAPKVEFNADALKKADEALTAEIAQNELRLSPAELAEGSALYRRQCLHCHGLEGNGRGPTGFWVNPHPRDYRSGIFKFTSSNQDQGERKPRRADLKHILLVGVEGTSMPSFGSLPDKELEAIVSYVIHLSLRGEAELSTMNDTLEKKTYVVLKAEKELQDLRAANASQAAIADATAKLDEATKRPDYIAILRDDLTKPTLQQALDDNLALTTMRWVAAQKPDKAIVPSPYTYGSSEKDFLESAARGAKVFQGAGGCIQCHQNYGRESNLTYDAWGTIVRGRNLFDGVYRGGRRPVDLYNRVHSGINGAGMTKYDMIKDQLKPADLGLNDEQFKSIDPLWDIVNFLQALPFPDLRVKLREKPYNIHLDI